MERELEGLTDIIELEKCLFSGSFFKTFFPGKSTQFIFGSGFGFASWLFVRLPLLFLESQSSLLSFTIAYKVTHFLFVFMCAYTQANLVSVKWKGEYG